MPGLWLPGGRGGWIRTNAYGSQSPVPYRLATALYKWRSVEDSNLCDVAAGHGLAIRPLTCSGNAPYMVAQTMTFP